MRYPRIAGPLAFLMLVAPGSSCHAGLNVEGLDKSLLPCDRVVEVRVYLEQEDPDDLLANVRAEEYKDASIAYNRFRFEHVGFQTKGNSSLQSVASSGSKRFSLKVDVNDADPLKVELLV